jgi:DUF1680 family protein
MRSEVRRRDFLKSVSAAIGTLAYGSSSSLPAHAYEKVQTPAMPTAMPVISSTAYSPSAYPIQAKPFHEVVLTDTFWQPKMKRNAEVTIPFEIQKFQERQRPISNNVLEAAIYSLQTYPDSKLQEVVDASVKLVAAEHAGKVPRNEMFEVASTYYRVTGKSDLLDVAKKSADALYVNFQTLNPPFSGGERDAINCIALYNATHDKRYLDMAKHYLDIRGLPNAVQPSRHNQTYKPVLEQSEAIGHAVNDASLMVSLVDVGTLMGLNQYFDAANRIWSDAVSKKMYITGGIGSTGNEGFGQPYSLPNLSAYSEICACIMFSTFNHKMFLATGDGKYIDVMERSMYNNVVDGVTASGDHFFYVNRLASAGDGRDVRWDRASLECCPPNLVRFMASMPGYIYAQRNGEIYVNLYVSSNAKFQIGGNDLALDMTSDMPWGGKSSIKVTSKEPVQGILKLRIPGWVGNQPVPSDLYSFMDKSEKSVAISVNGKEISATPDKFGYVAVDRAWKMGDTVQIEFPMEIRRVEAHSKVAEDRGRMAIEKGPIVFCAEWPDYKGGKVLTALFDPKAEFTPTFDATFFGGAVVLTGQAKSISMPRAESAPIKLIPYHLWANRGAGEMTVWLSKEDYVTGDIGPAGGIIFYVNKNYANDGWRYLEAAPRDQSAGAKWGSFRIPISGAYGAAIGTGRQNTLDIKASCNTLGIAADLALNYSLNGFKDWFLPSDEELAVMYVNLKASGLVDFDANVPDNFDYWSSTQVTTDMARHRDFADDGLRSHYDDKDYPRRVRAIRAF